MVVVVPVDGPPSQTLTVFIEVSASVRVENTRSPPTTTLVDVVGRCSTIWQRFVELS